MFGVKAVHTEDMQTVYENGTRPKANVARGVVMSAGVEGGASD